MEKSTKAETYLRKWIGRLISAKSAPKKIGNSWRKGKYSYIHTNVKQFGLEVWFREYLQERYCVGGLTELSDDQLKNLYNTIARKKAHCQVNYDTLASKFVNTRSYSKKTGKPL